MFLMARDDFKQPVIDALAKRAGYLCCNPVCQDPFTSLPHSEPHRAINLGVAAHICAASKGGPRYDPNQTTAERSSAGNGIWLCHRCEAEVDRDTSRYTVKELLAWKSEHEAILSSAPLRTALFASGGKRPASDKALAREILNYFADRRMLFEGYAWESPREVFESVKLTREALRGFLARVADTSELISALNFLQDTYFTFLRHSGDLSSPQRLNEQPWESSERFRFALSALRKSCGFQFADIAKAYKLSIPQRLVEICPKS